MEASRTTFSDWTLQRLEDEFGLRLDSGHADLLEWTNVDLAELSGPERDALEKMRKRLADHAPGWNEEELKMYFLGPLITLVDFDSQEFNFFAGRWLGSHVNHHELCGIVDGIVARGHWEPVHPYFCLTEYKPEKGRDRDPGGQTVSAMLAARELNNDGRTMYGSYILGRFWFFLTLDGQRPSYGMSKAYDASSEDIEQIFLILRRVKNIAARGIAALPAAGSSSRAADS
jgi:hypothetical protein